jgi:hypothetical protein
MAKPYQFWRRVPVSAACEKVVSRTAIPVASGWIGPPKTSGLRCLRYFWLMPLPAGQRSGFLFNSAERIRSSTASHPTTKKIACKNSRALLPEKFRALLVFARALVK